LSHLEPAVFAENGHFDVVFGHLALKSLFQRENGDVNGILKLNILAVPLTRSETGRGRAGRARGLMKKQNSNGGKLMKNKIAMMNKQNSNGGKLI